MVPELSPKIIVEERSLEQHVDGTVTAVIYWQMGNWRFPDGDWNDFIVLVLRWWVQAVVRLADGSTSTEALRFMDGPFEVRLRREKDVIWFSFVSRRRGEQIEASVQGRFQELCRTLGAATTVVLRVCRAAEMHSSEIEQLAVEAKRLPCVT
jgi:hypothetical protein